MPDSEQLTDPARLVPLLDQLAKRHVALTVQVPGQDELFTSYIVDVDRKHVLLDELLPVSGHQLLLRERSLEVAGKLDGIEIRFITTLERVDEQGKVVTYYMNLPKQLEYRQRRLAYRVHIPMAMTLRVIIDHRDGTVHEGVLHDLSHGGAGMIFPADNITVEHGPLQECAIEFPDEEWLYCAVELRYSKNIPSRNRQLIGAQFAGLLPVQERLVGRCINELERELIKKRASY